MIIAAGCPISRGGTASWRVFKWGGDRINSDRETWCSFRAHCCSWSWPWTALLDRLQRMLEEPALYLMRNTAKKLALTERDG
jgi:hypothetical protein